jgi:cadmium resistance protein CadD (predicted permease)
MDVLISVIEWLIKGGDSMPIFATMNAETLAVMIPITSIMGGIAVAIVAIVMGARKKELEHKERLIAMEKGLTIPESPKTETRPAYQSNRSGGFVMTCIGTAITVALWTTAGAEGGVWGLIPLAIGIGLLISSAVEKKETDQKDTRSRAG